MTIIATYFYFILFLILFEDSIDLLGWLVLDSEVLSFVCRNPRAYDNPNSVPRAAVKLDRKQKSEEMVLARSLTWPAIRVGDISLRAKT
ncbi:hypothetical protein LIA77_01722 [Sarocladium implicatum]|jgi:hypothetical protein|nr:hypothetical protein LIA77_01722 [Sarocladium implicatum]